MTFTPKGCECKPNPDPGLGAQAKRRGLNFFSRRPPCLPPGLTGGLNRRGLPSSLESFQERIFARVTPEVHTTLRQAAEISGATLNQFLVQSALKEAHAIIEREQIIRLTQRDAELFFAVLENPPAPSEKLREAVTAYRTTGLDVQD